MSGAAAVATDTEISDRTDPCGGDEVLRFLQVLWSVDHNLQRASKQMEQRCGVTGPQRLALRFLARAPDTTPGQLARLLHVHPSTLTGILQRLLRGGLIARRKDTRDARRAQISLTEQGRRIEAETAGTVEELVLHALSTVPRAQVAAAEDLLSALAATMQRALPDEG